MNIKRIGAINWDSALPKNTYFGASMLEKLGNDKFCSRLPYFAQKTEDGYDFPTPTQELYDGELEYAVKYGIDFFAYCWYPENDGKEKNVGIELYPFLVGKVADLNVKRKLYQSSGLKNKINYCAIIFDIHAYSDSELDSLIEAMKEENYEKIDGRPMVIIYLGLEVKKYNGAVAETVKKKAEKAGIDPYFTLIASPNDDNSKPAVPRDYIMAMNLYAVMGGKSKSYLPLADAAVSKCESLKEFGVSVIPVISAGWNPSPRIDRPISWVDAYSDEYADEHPDYDGFLYAFRKMGKWVENNPTVANTGYALVFAWNEFEEGGYLCPTLGKDGTPNISFLEAFSKAKR